MHGWCVGPVPQPHSSYIEYRQMSMTYGAGVPGSFSSLDSPLSQALRSTRTRPTYVSSWHSRSRAHSLWSACGPIQIRTALQQTWPSFPSVGLQRLWLKPRHWEYKYAISASPRRSPSLRSIEAELAFAWSPLQRGRSRPKSGATPFPQEHNDGSITTANMYLHGSFAPARR